MGIHIQFSFKDNRNLNSPNQRKGRTHWRKGDMRKEKETGRGTLGGGKNKLKTREEGQRWRKKSQLIDAKRRDEMTGMEITQNKNGERIGHQTVLGVLYLRQLKGSPNMAQFVSEKNFNSISQTHLILKWRVNMIRKC